MDIEPTMYFMSARIAKDGTEIGCTSCWIVDDSIEIAIRKAIALVESQDLHVTEVFEVKQIKRECYCDSDEGLQYYHQALIDQEVCVLYV